MAQSFDISGYNATFRSFVTFAEGAMLKGKGAKSIANAQVFGGRNISIVESCADKTGFAGGFHRTSAVGKVNDATRNLFLKSVIDMFGGEKNIPKSVEKALKTEDYYRGKPLTARRILAVSKAIDDTGILIGRAKAVYKSASAAISYIKTFTEDKEMMARAKALGFTSAETPKLALAVRIARVLKNFDALKALLDAGKLTAKEVVKICYPEIKNPGKDMLKAVNDFDNTIDDTIENELDEAADMSVRSIMQNTGCTLDEAVSAYKEGRAIPFAKYATGYSFSLTEYNAGGYGQVVGDLTRGYNNYEVTRDDKTGAVTIRTYSPEALPVKFEWKTTVDRNGNCVSTPMTVTAK